MIETMVSVLPDYETEPSSSRAWILISAIHRMARRLAR
jgi:hypothetical protein